MPDSKEYQSLEDRIRDKMNRQLTADLILKKELAETLGAAGATDALSDPARASICPKRTEDEEFIRRGFIDVKTIFLDFKKSIDSLVSATGPSTPGETTRKAKREQSEGGPSTPQDDIPARLIALSNRAGHAAAVLSKDPEHNLIREVNGLYKEMAISFTALKNTSGLDQSLVQSAAGYLDAVAAAIPDLCLQVDAFESRDFARLRLYRLESAANDFYHYFNPEKSEVKVSTATWKTVFPEHTFQKVDLTIKKFVELGGAIRDKSKAAAAQCDPDDIPGTVDEICAAVIDIENAYHELICKLENWECQVDADHFMIGEVKTFFEGAGIYVASTLKVLQSIRVEKTDWITQLKTDFKSVQDNVVAVKREIDCWAERQLCPPPDHCRETSSKLLALTERASQQAATISASDDCCSALEWLSDIVNKTDSELHAWADKAKPLASDPEFPYELFDRFWWPIARIRLALCKCQTTFDPCYETNQLLARYFKIQEKLKTSVESIEVDLDLPSRRCAGVQPTPPTQGSTTDWPPKPVPPQWVPPSKTYTDPIGRVLMDALALANKTKEFVSGTTRVKADELVKSLGNELTWLGSDVSAGRVSLADFRDRTLRQWNSFRAAAQTSLALARTEAAEEGRLKADISVFDLALKSKKIFDLEGQLAASDARMKSLLGVPRN